jgi:formylglycine-generating enzyme required for sulfatase activity
LWYHLLPQKEKGEKRMNMRFASCCAVFGAAFVAGTVRAEIPVVSNVTAAQVAGTKDIEIRYDVQDADSLTLHIRVEVSKDGGIKYNVPASTFTGDYGENVAPGAGKVIVWKAGTDWDGEYSDQMRVKVIATDAIGFPGLDFGSQIYPGGFLLGYDGGAEGVGESAHVNIPYSYWASRCKITAEQYAEFLNTLYANGKTVISGDDSVSDLNGNILAGFSTDSRLRWNVNKFEPQPGYSNYAARVTFRGALAFCAFYGYDLPTLAEWEKAARGPDFDDEGEHTLYPWGDTASSSFWGTSGTEKPVGYFDGNQVPIGPDTVNGYGLYDVCGGPVEWTRTVSAASVVNYTTQENPAYAFNKPETASGSVWTKGGWSKIAASGTASPGNYYDSGYSRAFRVVRRADVPEPEYDAAGVFDVSAFANGTLTAATNNAVVFDVSYGTVEHPEGKAVGLCCNSVSLTVPGGKSIRSVTVEGYAVYTGSSSAYADYNKARVSYDGSRYIGESQPGSWYFSALGTRSVTLNLERDYAYKSTSSTSYSNYRYYDCHAFITRITVEYYR